MSQLGDSNSGPEEKDSPQQDAEVTDVDTVSQDRPLIAGMVLACVVAGLALAMFLIALDTTIVATVRLIRASIPRHMYLEMTL